MKPARRSILTILFQILFLIVMGLFFGQTEARAQGRISGFVVDEKTRKPLPGANVVLLESESGTATAADGSFELLDVAEGVYTVQVSFIGYKTQQRKNVAVTQDSNIEITFNLVEQPIELREFVVTPGYFSIKRSNPGSQQILTRDELKSVALYGGDVFRAITRLPGVTGNDFSSKFAIRGGKNEEVLVLFDGLELYEPFHLKDVGGGVMSIIDMEAVGRIDLITGGFTAEYGDKMSGVFNIHSPAAPQNRASVGISLMNARLFAQRHFSDQKGQWTLSARRGYLDALMKATGNDKEFLPNYYDLFAKIQYQLGKRHSLSAHFLRAHDTFKFVDDEDDESDTGYGSTYGWLNFKSFITQKLFVQSTFSVGKVDQNREALVLTEEKAVQETVSDPRDFSFYGLKQDWSFELSKRFFIKWGLELKKVKANYRYTNLNWQSVTSSATGASITVVDSTFIKLQPGGHQFAAYLSDRVRIFSPLTAEVGLRYDFPSYTGDKTWSPRINLALTLGSRTAIKAGWGRFFQSQSINELAVQDNDEIFYPAELAEHRVLGIEHVFGNDVELRVEAYQKKLSNIRPRYTNLIGTLDVFPELSGSRVREVPEHGEAKGIEIYLKQDKGGKYSWWISYALTSVQDFILFRDVPRFVDQSHTLDLNFNYKPNKKWRINLAWLYHTGWPYTEMTLGQKNVEVGMNTVTVFFLQAGKLREKRLPAYHRLDLRVSRMFPFSKGGLEIFIEMINTYNRSNLKNFDYAIVNVSEDSARLDKTEDNWLPILPSVGLTWEF
ncbi:MAG: TonB-dependent receptor domain-containing protein [bacterium]